jgi:hypothetical protein
MLCACAYACGGTTVVDPNGQGGVTGGVSGATGGSGIGGTGGRMGGTGGTIGGATGGVGGATGGAGGTKGGAGGTTSTGGMAGATATLWEGVPASEIPSPESLCAEHEQTVLAPCSYAELEALLVGRWWMCSGMSPVPNPAAIGLEFLDNGDWVGLLRASDGSVQRDSGFDGQGRWELLETGGCVQQLNFNLSTGGFIPAFPAFSDRPRKMLLGTGGDGQQPRYVAIP